MKIEYDWEDWQPPTRAKLIRRRIIGTIGLTLVVAMAVCLLLVLLMGILTIAFVMGGPDAAAGWWLALILTVCAGVAFWTFELHWMLIGVLHNIWLWSNCKMAVGVF